MAKISPVSIKYMIHVAFEAEGSLEKPDVIGAIFGQTEGLLGDELEMRELQKEGKIGRIEVELNVVDGKSIGEIKLPSALDKPATTIIAAALETIDRVGPTEAKLRVIKIEDVRGSKRDFILERAKNLLESLGNEKGMGDINKALKTEARIGKLQEYGEEKLPAGDISGNELIVVEGRADVVNLLKNRVNNVIGMNGTKLPAEISKLGEGKEITLFIDGDRGGKLIAKNVIANAKVAYVAVAPDGKEVEELEGKEILIALRKKIRADEFLKKNGHDDIAVEFKGDVREAMKKIYNEMKGSKSAVFVDGNFDVIRKVGTRDIIRCIRDARRKIFALIIDGTATGTIIRTCEETGIMYLGASNFLGEENSRVKLISL